MFTNIVICYLLYTDKINDTAVYLKEQIYEESDMPIVLFDSSFYYLDSNNAAKTVFNDEPVEFNETEVYVNYAFCLSKYEKRLSSNDTTLLLLFKIEPFDFK